ncbi:MAG: HGGxSTG domain-containing protein [Acidiphilium sp.]|jgi:uncharacterized protein YjcR|nr:HGGxSTG domain-containing protein [Acidiphilium sp.]
MQNPMEAKCGARNRAGNPCGNKPLPNGRCRFHGGLSTGPRTAEGIERIRAARTKHGAYGADMREVRAMIRVLGRASRALTEGVG